MNKKVVELSVIKKTKGKIEVRFEEIGKISNYVCEETNKIISDILEIKLSDSLEGSKKTIESLMGGTYEQQ